MGKRKGFTLVELLVVIAIIGLLMAILMPALSKVKNQARLLSCAANSKQIGTIMAAYQADNDGCVPVMRNKWALFIKGLPAESSLLSLAFRNYSGERPKLPTWLPPHKAWDWDQVLDYSENYLPDFYVCPFVRGKSQAGMWQPAGAVEVCPGVVRQNIRSTGRGDSYSTWIWPRDAGYVFIANHCYGPDHGKNKYGNLLWHAGGDPVVTHIWANDPRNNVYLHNNPVKFSTMRRISERTAVYCAHGEIDESSHDSIINYGSHKRMNRGGTNVIFGDSHVEWVQGSQICAGN